MKSFNYMFVILFGILKDGCFDDLFFIYKNDMKDDFYLNFSRYE